MHRPGPARRLVASALLGGSALVAQTLPLTQIDGGTEVQVNVNSTVARGPADALLLGFNVPWDSVMAWNIASSELWTGAGETGSLRPEFYSYLRGDFAGNVYRYPGGTNANYFEWERSVKPGRVYVSATNHTKIRFNPEGNVLYPQFGLDEFLAFVKRAKGVPFLTINLFMARDASGVFKAIGTDPVLWARARQSAVGWLEYCNAPYADGLPPAPNTDPAYDWNGDGVYQATWRKNNGREQPHDILYWEIDNELDTVSPYYYSPANPDAAAAALSLYASRAREIMQAMQDKSPVPLVFIPFAKSAPWDTRFASTWQNWHNRVLDPAHTANLPDGIAYHPYYDGNGIPYTNTFIDTIWSDSKARAGGSAAAAVRTHLTEHAMWPWSDIEAQKNDWPVATSISGAISVADFIISVTHKTQVRTAFLHSLSALGPWALFSQVNAGDAGYVDNSVFAERPLARALKLVHRALPPNVEILGTTIATPIAADYPRSETRSNKYDVRATGYRHGSAYGALLINRAETHYSLRLALPGWTAGEWIVRHQLVGGTERANVDDSANHAIWNRYQPVTVSSGRGYLKLPMRSVSNLLVVGPNLIANGRFSQTNGSLPLDWSVRTDGGVTGTAAHATDATGVVHGDRHVRLVKTNTSPGLIGLVQDRSRNPVLSASGLLAARPDNRFVLRALVRTNGLSTGARLKMQFFATINGQRTYVSASPVSEASKLDTAGKWELLQLEFAPSEILQGAPLFEAEIILLNWAGGSAGTTAGADFAAVTLQMRDNALSNPSFSSSTLVATD